MVSKIVQKLARHDRKFHLQQNTCPSILRVGHLRLFPFQNECLNLSYFLSIKVNKQSNFNPLFVFQSICQICGSSVFYFSFFINPCRVRRAKLGVIIFPQGIYIQEFRWSNSKRVNTRKKRSSFSASMELPDLLLTGSK